MRIRSTIRMRLALSYSLLFLLTGGALLGVAHTMVRNSLVSEEGTTERRVVEYGSSLAAVRAAGLRGTLRDSVVAMSAEHLDAGAPTVFERLEDAGLVTGAVNFTCYRGRHRHRIRLPGLASRNRWFEFVSGPRRFFFFNLYESDHTGAPFAVHCAAPALVTRRA